VFALTMPQQRAIDRLLRQQSAVADFGSFAFSEVSIEKVLSEAVRACAKSLAVPFAKICRYRAEQNDLVVVAGCGWNAGVIGYVVSPADETSTQGRASVTGKPVILEDVTKNSSLALPPFYAERDRLDN
jgi:hypothetical protein